MYCEITKAWNTALTKIFGLMSNEEHLNNFIQNSIVTTVTSTCICFTQNLYIFYSIQPLNRETKEHFQYTVLTYFFFFFYKKRKVKMWSLNTGFKSREWSTPLKSYLHFIGCFMRKVLKPSSQNLTKYQIYWFTKELLANFENFLAHTLSLSLYNYKIKKIKSK